MQKNNDNIQFESRSEIETLMLIVQEWQEKHQGDKKMQFSQELTDKLDAMYMSW